MIRKYITFFIKHSLNIYALTDSKSIKIIKYLWLDELNMLLQQLRTLPIYMGFLMTEPNSISCTQLAETYNISHDSVNRFLEREDYTPHDLYQEAIQHIDNNKLIVSIDDTVLDKPYSQHMDLVSYFFQGKHHRSVKGINSLPCMRWSNGQNIPINFEFMTNLKKNQEWLLYGDVLKLLSWGAKIQFITGDSWYSSTGNLKP